MHQSILLTQGQICEIFTKKFQELAILETAILKNRPFWIFFFKIFFFFCFIFYENQSKFVWKNGWVEILRFSLVSRKFLAVRNMTLYSVIPIKQLIFKNKKSHVKKLKRFQHFVNISTDSKSSVNNFFLNWSYLCIYIDIKIQKSTKHPIFLMIFCAENVFFEKIITG